MPFYELSMIVRPLSKPELVSSLKRTAETILGRGGILRKFTSVGSNPLPFKMKAHNVWHKEGIYFIMQFNAPTPALEFVRDELRRDIDLIRSQVIKVEEPRKFACTLEEEQKPPAYRKSVQKLIEEGRKTVKPMYKQNSPGFDYYPFQK